MVNALKRTGATVITACCAWRKRETRGTVKLIPFKDDRLRRKYNQRMCSVHHKVSPRGTVHTRGVGQRVSAILYRIRNLQQRQVTPYCTPRYSMQLRARHDIRSGGTHHPTTEWTFDAFSSLSWFPAPYGEPDSFCPSPPHHRNSFHSPHSKRHSRHQVSCGWTLHLTLSL